MMSPLTRSEVEAIRFKYPRPWVLTNGVFDLLHPGHVDMLEQCRQYGTVIVALNSDNSVKLLGKGEERPYVDETGRAIMLLALKSVDVVVTFETLTAASVVRELKPDYYVKGPEYEGLETEETKEVEAYGGSVLYLRPHKAFAKYRTTMLVEKIRGNV